MYIIHDIMNLKPNFVQGVKKIPNPPPPFCNTVKHPCF